MLNDTPKYIDFHGYHVYPDGSVYSPKSKQFLTLNEKKECYNMIIQNGGRSKTVYVKKLVYELYTGDLVNSDTEYVVLINKDNCYHYTNLKKLNKNGIHRKNISELDLDPKKNWKIIKEFGNDDYYISDHGDIFSLRSWIYLKPTLNAENYYNVELFEKDQKRKFLLHRLVYNNFIGFTDTSKVIDHINNEDRTNNHISNLQENTRSGNAKNREFKPAHCRPIRQYLENGMFRDWVSAKDIQAELNYKSIDNIYKCCRGGQKTAHGFKWGYLDVILDLEGYKDIITGNGIDYPGYLINNKGTIINGDYKILTPHINYGYYTVSLTSSPYVSKVFKVHRLVAFTFLEKPDGKYIVAHKRNDEGIIDMLNNDVNNLEWRTYIENGTLISGRAVKQFDPETGQIVGEYRSIKKAYEALNKVYDTNIGLVCNGERKIAWGYIWEWA